jgi:hypothetical protein
MMENDPFYNDGCTGWFDGWSGVSWRACCDLHDAQFRNGDGILDFLKANIDLAYCVAQTDAFMAIPMFLGVMFGGAFFYFTRKKTR